MNPLILVTMRRIFGLRYRWKMVEKRPQTRGRRSTSNRPQVIRLLGAFQSRPNNLTHMKPYGYHYCGAKFQHST